MNREDIIRMAREAWGEGKEYCFTGPEYWPEIEDMFERFAALVAAAALAEPVQWTDADADAARLALELEALLMDTKDLAVLSRWWGSGHDALALHRQRLRSEWAHGIFN